MYFFVILVKHYSHNVVFSPLGILRTQSRILDLFVVVLRLHANKAIDSWEHKCSSSSRNLPCLFTSFFFNFNWISIDHTKTFFHFHSSFPLSLKCFSRISILIQFGFTLQNPQTWVVVYTNDIEEKGWLCSAAILVWKCNVIIPHNNHLISHHVKQQHRELMCLFRC